MLMKAVRIHAFGGPERLVVEEVQRPRLERGCARVRVVAAGVNPVDWIVREHLYNPAGADRVPMTLGQDFAGIIEDIGRGTITRLRPGDAVIGQAWGAFAEEVLVPLADLVRKPASLDMETAASLPMPGLTAWQIVRAARLRAGTRLLVHGGGGAVGSMCVQLAKRKNAYVIATASRASIAYLQSIGADEVFDYKTGCFDDRAPDIDVAIEHLGGETQRRSMNVLRRGGLLVNLIGQVDRAAAREAGVHILSFEMKYSTRDLADVAEMAAERLLQPRISAVLPLAEARRALDMNQHNESHGKIVLRMAA